MIGSSLLVCFLDLLSKEKVKEKPNSAFPQRLTKRITLRRAQNPGVFGGF